MIIDGGEVTEAVPDEDWLKGDHPCEGCSTIVGDGIAYCPLCEQTVEDYENRKDDPDHIRCGTFK